MAASHLFAWILASLALCEMAFAANAPNRVEKEHVDTGRGIQTALSSDYEQISQTQATRLTYIVCNLAPKGLVFRWPRPGVESGLVSPLRSTTCAVHQRDVPSVKAQPENADILYTQSGQVYEAQAFVPDETIREKASQVWTSLIRIVMLKGPYKQPDKRYDAKVVVTDKDKALVQDISWPQGVRAVALQVPVSDAKTRDAITEQLRQQKDLAPSSAVLTPLEMKKQVAPEDAERHSAAFETGSYVRLEAHPGREQRAQITLSMAMKRTVAQRMLLLDDKNRVVWVVPYTTGVPD